MQVPLLDGHKRETPAEPKTQEITTAFIIMLTKEGKVMISADLATPILRERAPSSDEIQMLSGLVASDMLAQKTAGTTANTMMNISQAVVQAQQDAALQAEIAKTKRG